MYSRGDESTTEPVFKKCVRCEYSLRGLPSCHACPECGLRFDENCGLYRVANPWPVAFLWLAILGGGSQSLANLRHLGNLTAASGWQKTGVLAAIGWIIFVVVGGVFLIRRFRRGFVVAVTGDGLLVRLPGWKEDIIPWSCVGGAWVRDIPARKPQVAAVQLTDRKRFVDLGGIYNIFPTRGEVERFVVQVHAHLCPDADEATDGSRG